MKKTVLAMLAGMVCAISFACISGGDDYSGDNGNANHGSMPGDSDDLTNGVGLMVRRVTGVNYLAYDFTCFPDGYAPFGNADVRLIFRGSPNKTLVYIAEINGVKHVEAPSFSNNDGSVSFSSSIYNRKTVHLPLRVKVGLIQAVFNVGKNDFYLESGLNGSCEACGYDRSYYQPRYAGILADWRNSVRNVVSDFSLVLQYQVAGSGSWTTVSRTRFSDIQQQVFQWQNTSAAVQMSKPKYYFLNGKIDGDFSAGTTLLIRIVAESANNDSPTVLSNSLSGWESFGEKSTWTKEMTSTSSTGHFSVGSVGTACHYLFINGFSPGLNSLYSVFDSTGNLNWCPLQWMAVTIGEGRKPE